MNDLLGIVTCVCPICHQKFDRLSVEWTYQITRDGRTFYYCRYSHWTQALQSDKVSKNRVPHLSKEQKAQLFKMLDDGMNPKLIATKMDVTDSLVYYYRRRRKKIGV